MYTIRYTTEFEHDLKKLDKQIARRIIEKMEWLAEQTTTPGAFVQNVPKNLRGLRKYRVGDWRVLFWVSENVKEIVLYGVENRGTVYRRFS